MTIYHNTIEKVTQPISVIDGLSFSAIEQSQKKINTRVYEQTIKEDINDTLDFDRVFSNVDVIEDMSVFALESKRAKTTLKIRIDAIIPMTSYDNTLTILDSYEEKLQR